ncbi:hypothetical protein ACLOJK_015862 [Asimina triloba]
MLMHPRPTLASSVDDYKAATILDCVNNTQRSLTKMIEQIERRFLEMVTAPRRRQQRMAINSSPALQIFSKRLHLSGFPMLA